MRLHCRYECHAGQVEYKYNTHETSMDHKNMNGILKITFHNGLNRAVGCGPEGPRECQPWPANGGCLIRELPLGPAGSMEALGSWFHAASRAVSAGPLEPPLVPANTRVDVFSCPTDLLQIPSRHPPVSSTHLGEEPVLYNILYSTGSSRSPVMHVIHTAVSVHSG